MNEYVLEHLWHAAEGDYLQLPGPFLRRRMQRLRVHTRYLLKTFRCEIRQRRKSAPPLLCITVVKTGRVDQPAGLAQLPDGRELLCRERRGRMNDEFARGEANYRYGPAQLRAKQRQWVAERPKVLRDLVQSG